MGIREREALYLFLRELSEYLFGDEGKGCIWGPTMVQFDNNKPDSLPLAWEILKTSGLPTNEFGWEVLLEQNGLSVPALVEQIHRYGLSLDEVYSKFNE